MNEKDEQGSVLENLPEENKSGFPNEEQKRAIDARGRVIVSASAGSGKTAVMIARIIQLILSGVGVDEILAVTFTKKAAAQMKEKLSEALIKNINAEDTTEEKREMLKKQLAKVNGADISTIDSFCARVLRSRFYATDVDNAFRVIDSADAEGVALKNQALDEMLEEGYAAKKEEEVSPEEWQKKQAFFHLLSVYWRKKSDSSFRKIFLEKYDSMRSRADYKEYLEKSKNYDKSTFDSVCQELYARFKARCAYYRDLVEAEHPFFEQEFNRTCKQVREKKQLVWKGDCKAQLQLSKELALWLTEFCSAPDYFAMREVALAAPDLTKNTGTPKTEEQSKRKARLGALRKSVGESVKEEFEKVGTYDQELEKFLLSAKTAAALAVYFLEFDRIYMQLKRERGVLDYSDLELKALELLETEEISREMRAKYKYVFVDEYQDVNDVQDRIVEAVSGDELFLVGDMKQAIYGFRGSNSKIFQAKQEEFRKTGVVLELSKNFRSSGEVLDAVNKQFSLAMTEATCGIKYKDAPMIKGNLKYKDGYGKVRVHFVGDGKGDKKEDEETVLGVYSVRENMVGEKSEESRFAAAVHYIIEEECSRQIFDLEEKKNNGFRRARYSDIAVLSRSKQGEISRTVAALAATGLPVSSASAVNICDFAEIKTLMDILSLLDNAEQDIPLCSALMSAMGKMSAAELTEIRLAYPDKKYEPFRTVCKLYAEEQKGEEIAKKLAEFFAYYEQMRNLSRVMSAGEVLVRILGETGMEARLLAQENGGACLRRIRRFLEEATLPEPLSVHAFLDRLANLRNEIKYSESGGEDAVKVLTMHSSKGLEYPIVILDNLSAPFHAPDSDEVVLEEKYGLAPRAFNEKTMCKSATLLRRLYKVKEKESSIADELNLYYVAMTRAKSNLHLVFTNETAMADVKYGGSFAELTDFSVWEEYCTGDLSRYLSQQKLAKEEEGSEETVEEMTDGVEVGVEETVGTDDCIEEDPLAQPAMRDRQTNATCSSEKLVEDIVRAFRWEYAYAGYENLPVKSSATALVQNAALPENEDGEFGATESWSKDYFDGEDGETPVSADEKTVGTAYHAFLENFDFSLLYDENGAPMSALNVEEAIQEELASGKEGYELLSVKKLKEILANPVFKELLGARLYKERQFLVSLPIAETYAKRADFDRAAVADIDGEEMIFQGAIDLLAVSDVVRIIDYKYSSHGSAYLRAHYKPQLDLYKMAVAKILDVEQDKIRCTIINIRRGVQVDMD